MVKKLSPAWNVGLLYYVVVNLISIVPLLGAYYWIGRSVRTPATALVLSIIALAAITIGAVKLSAMNINKQYLLAATDGVRNWALGYLVVFNGLLILARYRRDANSGVLGFGVLSVVIVALVYFFLTPRFVQVSSSTEIASADQAPKEGGKKVATGILKVAGLTIAAFILLIIILVIAVRLS